MITRLTVFRLVFAKHGQTWEWFFVVGFFFLSFFFFGRFVYVSSSSVCWHFVSNHKWHSQFPMLTSTYGIDVKKMAHTKSNYLMDDKQEFLLNTRIWFSYSLHISAGILFFVQFSSFLLVLSVAILYVVINSKEMNERKKKNNSSIHKRHWPNILRWIGFVGSLLFISLFLALNS